MLTSAQKVQMQMARVSEAQVSESTSVPGPLLTCGREPLFSRYLINTQNRSVLGQRWKQLSDIWGGFLRERARGLVSVGSEESRVCTRPGWGVCPLGLPSLLGTRVTPTPTLFSWRLHQGEGPHPHHRTPCENRTGSTSEAGDGVRGGEARGTPVSCCLQTQQTEEGLLSVSTLGAPMKDPSLDSHARMRWAPPVDPPLEDNH